MNDDMMDLLYDRIADLDARAADAERERDHNFRGWQLTSARLAEVERERDEWRNKAGLFEPIVDPRTVAAEARVAELEAEIKEWKQAAGAEADMVDELTAENKGLREALRWYAGPQHRKVREFDSGDRARAALSRYQRKRNG